MDILIQAEKVEKTFTNGRRKVEAVRGVSLQVRRGECFGLLGPNGAGKSTLISMIYGATVRTGGDLNVFSMDPNLNSRQIKRRLGVVTQENALDESLSVQENMELYAAFVGVAPNQRRARVQELLELMSLAHKAQDNIRALSGGMKRRLVFVRALLGDPELVILDEPTTGLDPAVRHLLWGKVNELKRAGKTVLLTTHYMHEAEVLCDRLVILNQGQVIAEGSPQMLRQRFTPGYVAVFESQQSSDLKDRAEALSMQVAQDSSGLYLRAPELAMLLKFQEDTGAVALQMRPSNLEDVFLKLTGQGLGAND